MQGGKHEKDSRIEICLDYYLKTLYRVDVLRSKSADELNQHISPDMAISPEMYQLLMESAMVEAIEFQENVCHNFSDGWDPDGPCGCAEYPECGCEPETPEQARYRLKRVEVWRNMSPDEFWIMMM